MKDWTLGSFLFWLVLAILVPAIIVRLTLGRGGGHRLFDRDGLSREEIRDLPVEMIRKRTIWNLKGSAAALAGLFFAMGLYPLGCLVGLPINVFGIPDEKLIYWLAGIAVLLITLGPALVRHWRDE